MKREEAKRLIVQAWDRWIVSQPIVPDRATGRDTLKFYLELKDAQSSLLKFQGRGRDKWGIVHGWLRSEGRADDSSPVLIQSGTGFRFLLCPRFLHANRYPPPDPGAGIRSKRSAVTTKPVVNLGMLCFRRQVARISVAFRIPRGAAALSN